MARTNSCGARMMSVTTITTPAIINVTLSFSLFLIDFLARLSFSTMVLESLLLSIWCSSEMIMMRACSGTREHFFQIRFFFFWIHAKVTRASPNLALVLLCSFQKILEYHLFDSFRTIFKNCACRNVSA